MAQILAPTPGPHNPVAAASAAQRVFFLLRRHPPLLRPSRRRPRRVRLCHRKARTRTTQLQPPPFVAVRRTPDSTSLHRCRRRGGELGRTLAAPRLSTLIPANRYELRPSFTQSGTPWFGAGAAMQMAASAISAPPNATRCRCLPLGTRVPMARSVPPRVGSGRPLHGTDLAARRGRTSSYMEWTVLTAVEEREGRGSFGFGSGRAYHYGEESFRHRTSTRHGKFRVLERFTYELLAEAAGMYCIAVLEVAHHAFLQHSHYDADEAMCDREGKSIVVLLYRTREL